LQEFNLFTPEILSLDRYYKYIFHVGLGATLPELLQSSMMALFDEPQMPLSDFFTANTILSLKHGSAVSQV